MVWVRLGDKMQKRKVWCKKKKLEGSKVKVLKDWT